MGNSIYDIVFQGMTERTVSDVFNTAWICSKSKAKFGGHPWIIPPKAAPCDSPNVVNWKSVPKVDPDMVQSYGFSMGFKKLMFRFNPSNPVRLTALFLKRISKWSEVKACQSFVLRFISSKSGLNRFSWCAFEKRFHGQTSWQTSHPNIQLSIDWLNCWGMSWSFNSMVK